MKLPSTSFSKQLAAFNPRPPLWASQIDDWERTRGAVLSADMRQLFIEMNGTEPAEDQVAIWPLERVDRLFLAAPEYADQDDGLFVFADYLIWSHAYAVRLVARASAKHPVF